MSTHSKITERRRPAPPRSESEALQQHIGGRLHQAREHANMTQRELSAHLGVTRAELVAFETGSQRLYARHLFQAAKVLKLPLGFFFQDAPGERPEPGPASLARTTRETNALVEAFEHIDDEDIRRELLGLLREMARDARLH